jgi:hypothetical protein
MKISDFSARYYCTYKRTKYILQDKTPHVPLWRERTKNHRLILIQRTTWKSVDLDTNITSHPYYSVALVMLTKRRLAGSMVGGIHECSISVSFKQQNPTWTASKLRTAHRSYICTASEYEAVVLREQNTLRLELLLDYTDPHVDKRVDGCQGIASEVPTDRKLVFESNHPANKVRHFVRKQTKCKEG